MKQIKKIFTLIILVSSLVLLAACGKKTLTVKFETGTAKTILTQNLNKGEYAKEPKEELLKPGFGFLYWELDGKEFDFNTPITKSITLVAKWNPLSPIEEDVYLVEKYLAKVANYLNLPKVGPAHQSVIEWEYDKELINEHGIVLYPKKGEAPIETEVVGTFTLGQVTKELRVTLVLKPVEHIEIAKSKSYKFSNLTTEYTISDGSLMLYYEDRGNIPYVKLVDFFSLLKGFIDPDLEMTFTKTDHSLEIYYEYYDEDEDKIYELISTIDVNDNTISTNDPGFFWAYIYETETNYGRHIFYDIDNEDGSYDEGEEVVFELSKYNLNLTMYEEEVLLPYYLANQLFAGSSYYNVYFNYDALYGIYALPYQGDDEYDIIKTSTRNNKTLPEDLVAHNYDMLAFNLDYFYGLKDIMEVDSYYEVLENYKKSLLSTNAKTVDNALASLILKTIDEPHTSFGYPSYYNELSWDGPPQNSLAYYGPRFNQWYNDAYLDVDNAIERKWGRTGISANQWAASSKSRPNYWFLDDLHAVLILDGFVTADIEEDSKFDKEIVNKILKVDSNLDLLPNINGGLKYYYYQNSGIEDTTLEILVSGLEESYLDTYKSSLTSAGFEHVYESSTTSHKKNGYYKITKAGKDYFLIMLYDNDNELFYLGITDKETPNLYKDKWSFEPSVKSLIESDSSVYMEYTLKKIFLEKPDVTSITLDLTWNSGGNVGALYRVVGFITDKPFRVSSYNRGTQAGSSSYVYIDGVPSYADLDWSLLVSPKTFSAGNSLTTIFKENNLGIVIGKKTGGGASSITPILLPSGTAFTMSSNNISSYRTGSGTEEDPYVYHDNEFGIEPDYPINVSSLFNSSVLLNILNSQ